MRQAKRKAVEIALASLLVLDLSAGSSYGDSSASQTPSPGNPQIVAPLTVTGFDPKIASLAGNVIKQIGSDLVLVNKSTGVTISSIPNISASPAGTLAATPYSTVTGNCGTSNISIINLNNQQYAFTTGFNLVGHYAVDYSWNASFSSTWSYPHPGSYLYEWGAGGVLAARQSWTSGIVDESTHNQSGIVVVARVTSGTVYTLDGSICTSGYPTASTTVW